MISLEFSQEIDVDATHNVPYELADTLEFPEEDEVNYE